MLCSLGLFPAPVFGSLSPSLAKNSKRGVERNHHIVKQKQVGLTLGSRKLLGCSKVHFLPRISINKTVKHGLTISAVVADDNPTVTSFGKDMENIGLLSIDPGLGSFKDHFRYKVQRYIDQKQLIEKYEGGLEEFSKGYLKFGFNREEGGIVYREWAPAAQEAQVIGDFNGWDGSNHRMEKNEFGVWSIKIPDSGGNPAIPHNSRVKFRFRHGNGVWVDRIPAWIRYAIVDPSSFGAPYDGVYWDPPPSERYQFKYPQPPKPKAPRIYEAHVGMSSSEPCINTYREFANDVLPRIRANNYNTVQLMAVMEHSYYGSFGYHVTNFFAVSSRSGTPEDLKYLIDKAHSLGLCVLMDVVHSHASNNVTDGLNGFDVGQSSQDSYFHTGDRGYHKLWDSRLFNYANWEVLRFLLSNLRWWLEEYKFDGFRFDGVTSMLYHHHGINMVFTGDYNDYFSEATDVDAVVYLMLANSLIYNIFPDATVIAEDVSGMPGLGRSVSEGGIGFDYRLAMAIPDKWIDYLKNKSDEEWSVKEISWSLTNRRHTEKYVAYAESHDQAIVGDKTIAFLLMDKEMYSGMSCLTDPSPMIERGIALHKMIHLLTMALGGEGYLNFMGNEFGHPEWIDFPREGNGWSYDKCRRQWNLVDTEHLRYKFMNAFDKAMNLLDEKYSFLASTKQIVSSTNDEDKVIVFELGDLVFVFNFHAENTYDGYKVGCDLPGKYRVALDSDAFEFGGHGRVGHDVDHFTSPEGIPGVPETNFNDRPNSFKVLSPARTCVAYYRVEEKEGNHNSSGAANDALTAVVVAKLGDFEEGVNQTFTADTFAKQEDLEEVVNEASAADAVAMQEDFKARPSSVASDVGPPETADIVAKLGDFEEGVDQTFAADTGAKQEDLEEVINEASAADAVAKQEDFKARPSSVASDVGPTKTADVVAKLGDFEEGVDQTFAADTGAKQEDLEEVINEASAADAVAKQEDFKARPSMVASDVGPTEKGNKEAEEIEKGISDD